MAICNFFTFAHVDTIHVQKSQIMHILQNVQIYKFTNVLFPGQILTDSDVKISYEIKLDFK